MFAEVCISLALIALAVFVFFAVRTRRTSSNRFSLLLVGIFVSSFLMFLPVYWEASQQVLESIPHPQGAWYPKLRTLVYSLVYGLKAVGGGQEMSLLEQQDISVPFLRFMYTVLNLTFYVAAPVMTSGLVLSLVGDVWDRIRYRLHFRGNFHIFSGPNSISINMAKQIRKKDPKAVVVFCQCKGIDKKYLEQLRLLGGLCLYAPCETLKLPFGKKKLELYLVDADEDNNLRGAERLIVKHRREEKCRITLNAQVTSGTGIQVVESMDKGSLGVRFFDGTALLCSNLLLRHPLYDLPADRDTISVAVIGCGRTGVRMAKSVAWCGQMDGKKLKLRIYDKDAAAIEQQFLAQCPELKASCDIGFCQVDMATADFEKQLMDPETGSRDATYCVVALGDDEENMEAAERIFRHYRSRNGYDFTPTILARVRGATKTEIYSGHENAYLRDRGIHTFGGVEEALAGDTLFHSSLEWLSFAVDLCYWGLLPEKDPVEMTRQELVAYLARQEIRQCRQAFLRSEYSRRSSMAAALHISAKLYVCGVLPEAERFPSDETAQKFRKALELEPELEERLARNEHLRWNAFMRSEGYRSASWAELERFYPQVRNNQDLLSKRHLCITDWENLEELNRKYLELNPPVRKNFKKSDFDLIRGIPKIIMLANRLDTTGADFDM
jgi:hypothetical protein